ncbi:hypothetical protein TcYC6_0054990 [Trypanosoma cruzi]|nr:hypothetical protein TcYC6_0054990 [Trypanosoma cruzi]
MFRAFGVTTWAPRIWDEGVSGVFLDLRGAYKNLKRAEDQAQLVFDSLVAWIDALEAERDPTDRFMNLGRILLHAFRMQLMMASDPGIPLFNILARLYTAVRQTDTFARATQPPLERRGTQISLRCQLCHVYGHVTSKSNVRNATGGSYSQRGRPLRNGEELIAASYEGERRQPHPFHHPPPVLTGVARNRRHFIRSLELPDAIIEKGDEAYPPTALDCGTTKHRHPRFGPATRREQNEVAREMWAPSAWEQGMSLAGQFAAFCCTHEQPTNEESCAAFLMAILDVAPSTRLQYARMRRSMLEMNRTPLDMMILGLQNIAAQSETKQVRPLTKEEMNQVIRSRTEWRERVVFRLAWITASRWPGIAALTPNNVTM